MGFGDEIDDGKRLPFFRGGPSDLLCRPARTQGVKPEPLQKIVGPPFSPMAYRVNTASTRCNKICGE